LLPTKGQDFRNEFWLQYGEGSGLTLRGERPIVIANAHGTSGQAPAVRSTGPARAFSDLLPYNTDHEKEQNDCGK
jgi:hypothetical protein